MIVRNKDQRVAVLVDVQNLYYSAKNLYKSRVNFKNLLSIVTQKRLLVRAIAYVIKADIEEQDKFFNALKEMGFEVRSKDLQIFFGGAKKGDWDVGMAIDAISIASKLDVIVLITGDGDLIPLVEYLQLQGLLVEIGGFGETTSAGLRDAADDSIDFSADKKRFLMSNRPEEKANKNKP